MKLTAMLVAILAAPFAHADCQDTWLISSSPTLSLSVDYSEGCYQGVLKINFSKPSKVDTHYPSSESRMNTVSFDSECRSRKKGKDGETIEFSCRNDGVSPLAGATYRFKQVKTTIRCDGIDEPDWDLSFICISGCGPTTPKRLEVQHGEGCS